MRTLVLISSLAPGGAERVTVSLVRALHARNEDVALCTVTGNGDEPLAAELDRAGVRRLELSVRRLADPAAFLRLVRLLRAERPDLVHAHGQDASILAALAHRLAPGRLVVTRHVLDEPRTTWRERLRARTTLRALGGADAVVAVSRAVAKRLHGLGLDPAAVRVIPNGIDLDRFDAAAGPAPPAAIRRSLGLSPDEPVALLAAVMRPGKGHGLMLDVVPGVRERVPDARFLLAGSGPLEAELRARAAHLGDAVRFLGHRDDIPALMTAADLVVLPSDAEALPTVLMEAAAAGRPSVATDVGGVPEVVVDGRTGRLVPADDPAALQDAVADLLADPARAGAMGTEARAVAEQWFGLGPYVSETLELWRDVAGRGS